MMRKMIKINAKKCDGCGLCAEACHENAIGMKNGKAVLLRDDYCDGLGDCLPVCPTNAISFEEREAPAYNAEAVKMNQEAKTAPTPLPCGCPGTSAKMLRTAEEAPVPSDEPLLGHARASALNQWPVQIKLVPVNAPYLNGAKLLIAADCAAYAHARFHERFMTGKIMLIGCPKLDEGDYAEKLTTILMVNDIRSITIVRMEVPCCGGLTKAVKRALQASGKMIPWQVVTLSLNGAVLE